MGDLQVHCAHCYAAIDDLRSKGDRSQPQDGDVTVCPLCCLISVFTFTDDEEPELTTRRPTAYEIEIALSRPEVSRAVMLADQERKAALEAVGRNGRR